MCAAPPVREGATPGVSGPVTLEVAEFQRGSVLAPVRPAVDCLADFPAAAPTADRVGNSLPTVRLHTARNDDLGAC